MRALTYRRYGTPDRLAVCEVAKPEPDDDAVCIRVHACALNAWDWDKLTGAMLGRLGGLFRPNDKILGSDIAGIVTAVGRKVTAFAPGDAVMGDLSESGWGGLAEYAIARPQFLAAKPEALSFEAAAAIPQAGSLALQGLEGKPQAGAGKAVLINGAGGGVGTFAIQIARRMGASVTGVDHGDKHAMMRALGADTVIDYRYDDFTRTGARYDLILDTVATRSVSTFAKALNPGGALCVVGGRVPVLLQAGLLGPMMSKREGKTLGLLMWQSRAADFARLADMAVHGEVTPVIDKVYPLDKAADAFRRIGAGKAKGKLVVKIC